MKLRRLSLPTLCCRPDNIAEPSNTFGNEKCAVANWTETYGRPLAWGWADTLCNQQFVPMCRMLRE
jgi:hypothetical protein